MKIRKTYKPRQGASIDVLVAGAGLAGLLVAARELKAGRSVHLTEKLSKAGGRNSPEIRDGFSFGAGFSFGDGEVWKRVVHSFVLPLSFLPIAEGKALVHGARGWSAPESLPHWEEYWSRPAIEFVPGGTVGWVECLLDYCATFDRFSFSLECPLTGLEVEAGHVVRASLGAEVHVQPKEVYWCADYKTLMESLGGQVPEAGPERVSWLKPFMKTAPQPGVILEFAHKQSISDFTETLLMPFSHHEKEERRYLVGAFSSNRDSSLAPQGKSLSSWILPLTEAEWGDNHESMKKIRAGKRLLEKAFPGFEQTILHERVLVLDSTVSPLHRRKGDWHPLCKNLHLAADWAMPGGATFESLVQTLLPS